MKNEMMTYWSKEKKSGPLWGKMLSLIYSFKNTSNNIRNIKHVGQRMLFLNVL